MSQFLDAVPCGSFPAGRGSTMAVSLENGVTDFNAVLDQKSGASERKVGIFVGMAQAVKTETGYSCGFSVVLRYLS